MPSFKFDASCAFLTYSQVPENLLPDDIINHLQSCCPIKWARIATERHQDGGKHFHVVCQFERRFQSKNQRIFDVSGQHPNIQRTRSAKSALEYVAKDGEFTDIGTVPASTSKDQDWVARAATSTRADFMAEAFAAGLTQAWAKEFWELGSCKQAVEIGDSYEANLEWECQMLREQALPENSCAVLLGPSGCGKSAWAKRVCPKPALWVSHMDVLRMFRADYHKSIIFDDMAFTHMPLQAQIHLTDWVDGRQIHCRYGYATIPAKTVKIFTCNEEPFADHPAINRRITKINLY